MSRDCDEYVPDPDHPLPWAGETVTGYNRAFLLEDQRFASRRPDVLSDGSEILAEDSTLAEPEPSSPGAPAPLAFTLQGRLPSAPSGRAVPSWRRSGAPASQGRP